MVMGNGPDTISRTSAGSLLVMNLSHTVVYLFTVVFDMFSAVRLNSGDFKIKNVTTKLRFHYFSYINLFKATILLTLFEIRPVRQTVTG